MKNKIFLAFLLLAIMIGTGCGGSGGGGTSVAPVTVDNPVLPDSSAKITGTAAGLSGVTITAYDEYGSQIAVASSNTDGSYEISLPYNQQVDLIFAHPSLILNGPCSGKLEAGETKTLNIDAAIEGYPPLPMTF